MFTIIGGLKRANPWILTLAAHMPETKGKSTLAWILQMQEADC